MKFRNNKTALYPLSYEEAAEVLNMQYWYSVVGNWQANHLMTGTAPASEMPDALAMFLPAQEGSSSTGKQCKTRICTRK